MNINTLVHRFLNTTGQFFFRVRNGLFPALLVVLVVFFRPARFSDTAAVEALATWLGTGLVLAGLAFRLAVIGFAYIRRGGKNRQVYANELVTRGFYAHTRNPMYVGNYAIALGLALVYGSPLIFVFVALFFAWVYLAITVAEETYLRDKFGADYDAYADRVNRFIPKLAGLKESLTEFEYDWRRALVKEYNTLCFMLAALLGLAAWKLLHLYGYGAEYQNIRLLGGLLLPLAAFYGTIRFLKKTKRLQPLRQAETEQEIQPREA